MNGAENIRQLHFAFAVWLNRAQENEDQVCWRIGEKLEVIWTVLVMRGNEKRH